MTGWLTFLVIVLIVAVILLIYFGRNRRLTKTRRARVGRTRPYRRCPYCTELIPSEALECPSCDADIEAYVREMKKRSEEEVSKKY